MKCCGALRKGSQPPACFAFVVPTTREVILQLSAACFHSAALFSLKDGKGNNLAGRSAPGNGTEGLRRWGVISGGGCFQCPEREPLHLL